MPKKEDQLPSMAEVMCEPRLRKAQNKFLNQVDLLIDWRPIRTLLNKRYTKRENAVGQPAYDVILLFKMLLLQTWYNLSDCALEERINDSITFSRFLGLEIEQLSPDHSTLSRFRTRLVELDIMDKVLKEFNKQLSKHHIDIRQGVLVDASIVDTPHAPSGQLTIEVADDREDTRSAEAQQQEAVYQETIVRQRPGTDPEASWVKKGKEFRYGFKKHVMTDIKGIILQIITTKASESDTKQLQPLLEKAVLPKGTPVYTDKGYTSSGNRKYLREHNLRDGVMHKAVRGKPLTEEEKFINRQISRVRYAVERTFGSIRRWFAGGRARYRGLAKT